MICIAWSQQPIMSRVDFKVENKSSWIPTTLVNLLGLGKRLSLDIGIDMVHIADFGFRHPAIRLQPISIKLQEYVSV